jgi:hypothetical protein
VPAPFNFIQEKLSPPGEPMRVSRRGLVITILSVLVTVGVARCLLILSPRNQLHDFAYLWLAGKLWVSGISPYSAEYVRLGKESLELSGVAERPFAFFYPPNWSVITIPMGLLPYRLAGPLWTGFNIVLIVASQIAIFFAIRRDKRSTIALLVALVFVLFVNGTRFNLVLGQTSTLVMFALAVIALGMARDMFWLRTVGIAIAMLKPNVGMVLVAPLLVYDFRAVLAAGAISLVLAIPALLIESPVSIISNLASSIASYGNYPINMIDYQTGVATIIHSMTGVESSPVLLSIIAAFLSLALFLIYSRSVKRDDNFWFGYLWIASATASFVVRFHMHDMVMVALLVQPLLLFKVSNAVRALCLASMLLLLRPEKLAMVLHFHAEGAATNVSNFLGANLIASFAMMGVMIALLAYLTQLWMSRSAAVAVPRSA